MDTHSQILVVSWNDLLLQTRRLILGAYFEVEGAGRLSEAAAILRAMSFELVILCDTLSDSECMQIFEFVKGINPRPEFLLLVGPDQERSHEIIGHTLCIARGPMDLLHACADILGSETRPKPRSRDVSNVILSGIERDQSVGSGKQQR